MLGIQAFSSYLYKIRFIILFYVLGDWASTAYAMPFGEEYNSVPAMILENDGIYYLLLVKICNYITIILYSPVDKNINV